MIRLRLTISNPFFKPGKDGGKDYFYKHKTLSKNKSFEIQISKWSNISTAFVFDLDLNWKGDDHAGPHLEIDLFGFMLDVKIYDHRHWDYENHKWEVYDEQETHSPHN